jgi:co-chaperonin GroES (HSP10)
MINVRPHRDRVLLELIPGDKISDGGIHIPDNAKRKYLWKARVLRISNDCKAPLIPGQIVYAVWNAGVEVQLGADNETRLIKSEDIYAAGGFIEKENHVRQMDQTGNQT